MQLLGYNGVLASFLLFINAFRVEIFKFLIDVFIAEGLKAFLSLSFPRVILGKFGKKPFPEFLKAFPDLERD